MTIQVDTGNHCEFKGRVVEVHEYSKDKAANITVSVENKMKNGQTKTANIQTKCFTPAAYNATKVGMLVKLFGHIAPGGYKKGDQMVYTQDVITDYIEFLEAKSVVKAREAAKSAKKNIYAVDFGE